MFSAFKLEVITAISTKESDIVLIGKLVSAFRRNVMPPSILPMTNSLTNRPTVWLADWLTDLLTHSFAFARSLNHSPAHSLTHSIARSLNRSITHSLVSLTRRTNFHIPATLSLTRTFLRSHNIHIRSKFSICSTSSKVLESCVVRFV